MKRLYSPWRSQYIATFKDKQKSKACIFCSMLKARDDEKNLIVTRGKHCFVVLNLYPYNSGHAMVVPYRHTDSIGDLTAAEVAEIMKTTSTMIKALTTVAKPQGFNFGANLGRAAGAGIDEHVHFHLVPRWNGDTNFMPVLADVKLVSERMEEVYARLRRALRGR